MMTLRVTLWRMFSAPLNMVGHTLLCLAVLAGAHVGFLAQAATTITPTTDVGNLGTQVLPPSGNVYGITGGTPVGTNLFHSFGEFSVGTGDIAQFQTSPLIPNTAMSNILGRVTGGNPSSIFGTVDSISYYPNANLFLINPDGILFGPGAQINVGGMATFTTANYLRLGGAGANDIFYAGPAQPSLLTNAPVAAFGFLGSHPAAISVQGSTLSVQTDQSLALVGGNHGFTYTNPDTGLPASVPDGVTMTGGSLSAASGQINIASVASAGEISAGDFMSTSGMTMGSIALSQGAIVDVSGDRGGMVRIRGGRFIMDNAFLVANSTVGTSEPTTAISVAMEGDIELVNGSAFSARALGDQRGGDIEASGRSISLLNGSRFETRSEAGGDAGDIRVSLMGELLLAGADAFNNPSSVQSHALSSGRSGSIAINRLNATSASTVTVADRGVIRTEGFADGLVRDVTIMVDRVNVTGGGVIGTTGTDLVSSGTIRITDAETISVSGRSPDGIASRIENQNSAGETGGLFLESEYIHLSDFGRLFSDTFLGLGDPSIPKMVITVHDTMTMTGEARADVNAFLSDVGALEVNGGGNLFMSGLSIFGTRTSGTGASGPMRFNLANVTATEGSQFTSATDGFANGGPISFRLTGTLTLAGQATNSSGEVQSSGIFSRTNAFFEDPSLTGNAGNITLTANGRNVTIADGARIDSGSTGFALGNAGNITVTAANVSLNDGTISNVTEFAGNAGTTTINTGALSITNGGEITSSAVMRASLFFEGETIPAPTGAAGHITVQGTASPAQLVLINGSGSGIFTDTQGTGTGGDVLINTRTLKIQNGGTISAATSGLDEAAIGGDVTVTASKSVDLRNKASISARSSGDADAGNITINAGRSFEARRNSSVTTKSDHAGGGNVAINATDQFRLVNSQVNASAFLNGGNISIDPNLVILQNSQILAQAIQGNGGNITIFTPLFLADSTSLVSASSQFGLNGTVSATSNLSVSLGALTSKPSQAQSLLTQRCAALANGQASSFVVAGREQLPADPGSWLSSPLAFAALGESISAGDAVASAPAIVAKAALDTGKVSLRRLTPAGFLIANFADSEATGCHS